MALVSAHMSNSKPIVLAAELGVHTQKAEVARLFTQSRNVPDAAKRVSEHGPDAC